MIIPAIDLRDGKCVRLEQGDYARQRVFRADPVATAQEWVRQGARRLHLVDLDGARAGRIVHADVIQAIVAAVEVPCQLGGGIRSDEALEQAWRLGVHWVVIGTMAIQQPRWFAEAAQRYPGRLLLGLDARDGRVAVQAWQETTAELAWEVAERFAHLPLAGVVYTDISRDGVLAGPNWTACQKLADRLPLPVLASGGVASLDDLRRLARMNLAGCIVGRALYEGKFRLPDAIRTLSQTG
jgi:phosphoribosylformimino-5-aminoimidazole carboxamide ribotide isomerase